MDGKEEILELLRENARLSVEDISAMTKKTPDEVKKIIAELEGKGIDVEMLDPDDISNALSTLDMNSFMTDISDQVMEKYSSEGEKAAQDFVMSSMADWISKNYTSALSALSYSHETVTVTVENQNGAWLITDMDQ